MSDVADDVLTSPEAGGKVIRGTAWRLGGNGAGIVLGIVTAALLLRHLGVADSGRYVTVLSLVAIASTIADAGLGITGSRELAVRDPAGRTALMANFLGLRLAITPVALLAIVAFATVAGYPTQMVIGTALAGSGAFLASLADAAVLRLGVQLRNAGLAFLEFLKQAVTLASVAVLVALGAHLTPFFAVPIVVGLMMVTVTPLLAGRDAFPLPRFDRAEQRRLLTRSLPLAASIVLAQLYFRLVIVLMSLISSAHQTGYFGGSLRAMETVVGISLVLAGVALPVLAAVANDDRARLRYAIERLGEGAVVAGVLVILVAVRAAEPVMAIIGGQSFRPAGAVLRIQVGALMFIGLYQIWTMSLVALGLQRKLILTSALGLLGVAGFAVALVPPFGAEGGAAASVLGDALLACLIYWRLRAAVGRVMVRSGFLIRVVAAAAVASGALAIPGLPNLVAAALAGCLFLGVGQLIGMLPRELRDAFGPSALRARRRG